MGNKILVVDDDEMSRRLAQMMLTKSGYDVAVAESGAKCLDILRQEEVDLVLLDMLMPEMDGIETLEQIRAEARWQELPVILLTASVDSQDAARAEKLGVVGCVSKPFKPQELLERVDAVMKKC